MRRNGFTIIEVVVVFLLILGVTFLVLPKNLETTREARLISKWTQKYSELEYMFSVIKAQQDSEIKAKLDSAKDNNARNGILLDTIKPYLRIELQTNAKYKQRYMNGEKIPQGSRYYFDKFYDASSNEIIGLKWIKEDCKDKEVCAMISLDMNGLIPPNKWGYDIFGVNILRNEIQPIGKGIDSDSLKKDCDRRGYGTYCSYYYLIGGRFD